jgi:hypothetical protein
VGPLHPVTWRLSLICSSAFTVTFIFCLPCSFLWGSERDPYPSNQTPSLPHSRALQEIQVPTTGCRKEE